MDDTGNAGKLPLAERARRGLLAAEPRLSIEEIAELEHPTDLAARKVLCAAIQAAIEFGDLPASYSEQEIPLTLKVAGL